MLVPVLEAEEEGRGSVPVRVTPYEKKPKGLFDTCIWSKLHTTAAQRASAVATAFARSAPVQALTIQLVTLLTNV